MSNPSVVYSSTPIYNPKPIVWTGNFTATGISANAITTSSIVMGTNTFAGSWTTQTWMNPHEKVRKGKYRVRCRGCARWAKILRGYGSGLVVNCDRCLGEKPGFLS